MPASDHNSAFHDFADQSDPRFKGVWPHFSSLLLKKGDQILANSTLGKGLYLIVDGVVGLKITNSEQESFIVNYESGTAPGIAVMLQPEITQTSGYEVVEDCSILFLEKHLCLKFMISSPEFSRFVLEEAEREMNLLNGLLKKRKKSN